VEEGEAGNDGVIEWWNVGMLEQRGMRREWWHGGMVECCNWNNGFKIIPSFSND
jgi:hypothetical protein